MRTNSLKLTKDKRVGLLAMGINWWKEMIKKNQSNYWDKFKIDI
jgi:hypothetical protein